MWIDFLILNYLGNKTCLVHYSFNVFLESPCQGFLGSEAVAVRFLHRSGKLYALGQAWATFRRSVPWTFKRTHLWSRWGRYPPAPTPGQSLQLLQLSPDLLSSLLTIFSYITSLVNFDKLFPRKFFLFQPGFQINQHRAVHYILLYNII